MKSLVMLFLLCLMFTNAIAFQQVEASSNVIIVPDNFPSITAAITNAEDGDVIYVRKGFYNDSTFIINKAITICGEDVRNTIVNLTTPLANYTSPIFGRIYTYPSDCITITSSNVKISGLTIRSEGGITVTNADNMTLVSNIIQTNRSCHFTGSNLTISRNTIFAESLTMMGHNLTLSKNVIDAYRNGIESNGDYSNIHGNMVNGTMWFRTSSSKITNNIYDLLFIFYGDFNTIINNSGELSLGNSDRSCSNNTITGNLMKGPSVWGIWIGEYCRNNVFSDNYIVDEGYFQFQPTYCSGVIFCNLQGIGCGNTFYHNVFINNSVNVKFYDDSPTGGNFWDNGSQGNYWSNYTGTDSNGDNIGDTPFIINSENIDNYPLIAPFAPPEIVVPPPTYDLPLDFDEVNSQQYIINYPSISETAPESSGDSSVSSTPAALNPPSTDIKFDLNMTQMIIIVILTIMIAALAVFKFQRH